MDTDDSSYLGSDSPASMPLRSPPPPTRPQGSPHPGAFRPRYIGDGLDYRRPVMSIPQMHGGGGNVIDLTQTDDSPSNPTTTGRRTRRNSVTFAERAGDPMYRTGQGAYDPARRRDQHLHHDTSAHGHAHGHRSHRMEPITIEDEPSFEDASDVTITQWNHRPPSVPNDQRRRWPPPRHPSNRDLPARIARHNTQSHLRAATTSTAGLSNMHRMAAGFRDYVFRTNNQHTSANSNPNQNSTHFPWMGPPPDPNLRNRQLPAPHTHIHPAHNHGITTLRLPASLNFQQVGFNLGGWASEAPSSDPIDREESSSTVALDDLPPVREGFTRNPVEGDECICPNCEEELCRPGSGNAGDGDEDAQVWVIKNCGHVYCGRCKATASGKAKAAAAAAAKKRRPAPRGKGKGRRGSKGQVGERPEEGLGEEGNAVKPLMKCVVDGCAEKTTGRNAMFPLYL